MKHSGSSDLGTLGLAINGSLPINHRLFRHMQEPLKSPTITPVPVTQISPSMPSSEKLAIALSNCGGDELAALSQRVESVMNSATSNERLGLINSEVSDLVPQLKTLSVTELNTLRERFRESGKQLALITAA